MAPTGQRSKFAFGSEKNVAAALASGAIDAYDILLLDEKKIGWVDKNGNVVMADGEKHVVKVDALPVSGGKDGVIYLFNNEAYVWNGTACTPLSKETDLSGIRAELDKKADAATVDAKIETAVTSASVNIVEF